MSRHVVDVVIGAGTLGEWRGQVETETGSPFASIVNPPGVRDLHTLLGQSIEGSGIPAGSIVVSIEQHLNRVLGLAMSTASTLVDRASLADLFPNERHP